MILVFGSNLSIAGGLHKALLSAERFGMETVQIFTGNPRSFGVKSGHCVIVQLKTKNQQQWKCRPLDEDCAIASNEPTGYVHPISNRAFVCRSFGSGRASRGLQSATCRG